MAAEGTCGAAGIGVGGGRGGGGPVPAADFEAAVDAMHAAALRCVPLSHLQWGLWGLVRAKATGAAIGFDFLGYAQHRLAEATTTAAADSMG